MKTMNKRPYEEPRYELVQMMSSVFCALTYVSGMEVGGEDEGDELPD